MLLWQERLRHASLSGYEKAPYVDWSNKAGNGSLYSTVDDLYRFDRALKTDAVLKAERSLPGRLGPMASCVSVILVDE